MLYTDPDYELRLFAHTQAGAQLDLPPGAPDPARALRRDVDDFASPPAAVTVADDLGLTPFLGVAIADWRESVHLADALARPGTAIGTLREITARALVARIISNADDHGVPSPDGAGRDQLLNSISAELHAEGRSISGWMLGRLAVAPLRFVTSIGQHQRGRVTDQIGPFAGDILRYQARGAGLRDSIAHHIDRLDAEAVTLLGHSLGGIASFELLLQQPIPKVDRLITVGSQASYLYELGALSVLEAPEPLPDHFRPDWLNVYDEADFLSYRAETVFGAAAVSDVPVDNGQPFPLSHSTYWRNSSCWEAMIPWIS